MVRLIQYNPTILKTPAHDALPGMEMFRHFGKVFTQGLVPIDRTGTVQGPVKTKIMFPIPKFRTMKKSYEEICNDRAKEILHDADERNLPMYIFWSGGIDSTLLLISLLKFASSEQKKRMRVLMTEESISENPNFYREHIYGKLRCESAMLYPYLIGTPSLLISGEQNDQLMGFDAIGRLMLKYGNDIIYKKWQRDTFFDFFNGYTKMPEVTNFYLDLFESLHAAAPMKIETHFHYLWWINFTMKWQNAYMRMLTCTPARNTSNVNPQYINDHYISFYGTEDFQLWSMNNLDKRIKDEWRTYKWVAKDVIYDFTKDADYRDNKTKRGSLRSVVVQQNSFTFIDENFKFYHELDPKEYYEPKNDFIIPA